MFKHKLLQQKSAHRLTVVKYLTMFFLGASCVLLMTQAFDINTTLSNFVQYGRQIFLTDDGSNSGVTGITLDGTNGNAFFSGKVGIGINIPSTQLQIVGDATGSTISMNNRLIHEFLSFYHGESSLNLNGQPSIYQGLQIEHGGPKMFSLGGSATIMNLDNYYLGLGAGGSPSLFMAPGGYIGIGVSSPAEALEVGNGNVRIDTLLSAAVLATDPNGTIIPATGGAVYNLISGFALSGPTGAIGPTGANGTNGTNGTNGAPGPAGAAGATGPQGPIGNTGPQGPAGANGSNGFLLPGSPTGVTPYRNGSSWIINSTNIYNDGGNVGIGTINPLGKLQVGDGITSVSMGGAPMGAVADYMYNYVGWNAARNNLGQRTFQNDNAGNGGAAIMTNVGGTMYFATIPSTGGANKTLDDTGMFNSTKMVIKDNGNVGIGTTSPQYDLDVYDKNGGGETPAIAIEGGPGAQDSTETLYFLENGGLYSYIQNDNSQNNLFKIRTIPYDISFGTNTTERMRITNGGNVGINTSVPNQKLEVAGNIRLTNDGWLEAGNNPWQLYLKSNSYVGINTNNPSQYLDVQGNVNIGNTSSASAGSLIIPYSGGVGKVLTSDANGKASWQKSFTPGIVNQGISLWSVSTRVNDSFSNAYPDSQYYLCVLGMSVVHSTPSGCNVIDLGGYRTIQGYANNAYVDCGMWCIRKP